MAKRVAAPKNTGGGGFVFEDDVCAWLLACMLSGESVFDADLGPPIRIDFQTRVDGWLLDDALVTTANHRFALSIKSTAQFTASAAPSEFVTSIWEQWLHLRSTIFQPDRDYMVLVTAPLSAAATESVAGLVSKAGAANPEDFPSRLATPRWASKSERSLFASFNCPEELNAASQVTEVDTARLLGRLRFLQHDFGAMTSESAKRALRVCRNCVRSNTAEDAKVLWNLLRSIAAELRPLAGNLSLQGLVNRVRQQVALADYPDHSADWSTLAARSVADADQVAVAIAGQIHIPRAASEAALTGAIESDELTALLGSSGSGKSAVAKAIFEQRVAAGERTLFLDTRSLDCIDFGTFESSLRLQHPLAELLGFATSENPLLILDGLDRLYSTNAFRNAAALLRLARPSSPATGWRIVVPCQSQEWPRVLEELQRAGAGGGTWCQLELDPISVDQLRPVSDALPVLARLMLQPRIAPLLTNLKLLDLVARRVVAGGEIDSSNWVGESSVAEWFWNAEIDRGSDRVSRGRFARDLAQRQADQLVSSVPTDEFDVSELVPLVSLAADNLCLQVPGDRIAFAHDLYGDWARLRILLNHRGDLPAFFKTRRESPLWHRALRLLGIHLLEHTGGVDDWRAVLASFRDEELAVLHDVLLEAPVFAINARSLLDAILPDLLANDGRLLRRLLNRFLAFGTVPNHAIVAVATALGMDAGTARATYRLPYWPLWLDVLAFLHGHKRDVLSCAASEIARLVEMWLEFAPKGTVRRHEAADLGVLLGEHALSVRSISGGGDWRRERERFYKCTLAAAKERPDDVAAISLRASERSVDTAEESVPRRRRRRSRLGGSGTMREPWPDGPHRRVDEAFQNVVLDSTAILELYRIRPSIAREVVLASLIQEPSEEDWDDDWMGIRQLEIVNRHKWLPALYTTGPFLSFLRENFTEGLELVLRLVEFAAAREQEHRARELSEARTPAIGERQTESEATEPAQQSLPWRLSLSDGDKKHSFFGDERVYGWSAGLGNPPDAILAALMALEQFFYQRLDEEKDVAAEVATTFERSKSVATLGVLCDIGKKHPALFEGPLRALLSAPEIYAWEIRKVVHGRAHLMIGASDRLFIKLAPQFHNQEHRKIDLRTTATLLMLQRPAMRDFFDQLRSSWESVPAANDSISGIRRQLIVSLNSANYEVRQDPEHGPVLVNVVALQDYEAQADERRSMDDRMLVVTLPVHCRTILDERRHLDDAQLCDLWAKWNRVRALASATSESQNSDGESDEEFADAIAGPIAVLLSHPDWCDSDASRLLQLEDALRVILTQPPRRRALDSDHSVSTWTSECFVAEAVAMLWIRNPCDEEWRHRVAAAMLSPRYATIKVLFGRCAVHRRDLGQDFGRLRRLGLEWAYVRDRVYLLQRMSREQLGLDERVYAQVCQDLEGWIAEKLAAFTSALSSGFPPDWQDCDPSDRFQDLDNTRRGRLGRRMLDFHVVQSSHEWLPLPDDAFDPDEREAVVQFLRSALAAIVGRPMADLTRGDHQHPTDDEGWVLEQVGRAVLQLRPNERPELLWEPVLELHSEGHDWPEALAHSLHRYALRSEDTPPSYANLVRSIVERAFVEVAGKRRWSWYEGVWEALVGIDWYCRDLWEPRHAAVVAELQDVFLTWMKQVPFDGRRLAGFSEWLSRPAAAVLRFKALEWMAGRLCDDEGRKIHRVEETEDDLARLLNTVWSDDEPNLRRDAIAFEAFRKLLNWLGTRQNQLGLELLGRIGNLV